MQKGIKPSDFCKHKFDGIGEASIHLIGDKVLISVTDGARLIRKDRKQLIKWAFANRIDIFQCVEPLTYECLTAIFFDDFIDFCLHEKNVADNYNAEVFLNHLLKQEKTA